MDRTHSHTKVLSVARAKLSFVWVSLDFVFFLLAFWKLLQKFVKCFSMTIKVKKQTDGGGYICCGPSTSSRVAMGTRQIVEC